jgi:hypothetical protein
MPTKRLTDHDKSWTEHQYTRVFTKAINAHEFPLKKEEIRDWFIDSMPSSIASAYREVFDFNKNLLSTSGYCSYFKIYLPEKTGYYSCTAMDIGHMPHFEPKFLEGSSHYDEVIKWAAQYWTTNEKIKAVHEYVEAAIYACTSAGQLQRVLPEESLRFLPGEVASTFKHAERKSRIPRDFAVNKHMEELLMEMLALGSISPEDRLGANVTVGDMEISTKP